MSDDIQIDLENSLIAVILSKDHCTTHMLLSAMVNVCAHTIYNCADDHGAKMAMLLDQFQHALRERMLESDHDEGFHMN